MSLAITADDKKEYEIAFVLATEDAEGEIGKTIAANGMEVTGKGPVAALKLAYPIKKHVSGFFGYCWFSGMPSDVKKIKETLALQPNVLRFLIVTPPVKPAARDSRGERLRDHSAAPKPGQPAVPQEKPAEQPAPAPEALSNELLEKKLEEILK